MIKLHISYLEIFRMSHSEKSFTNGKGLLPLSTNKEPFLDSQVSGTRDKKSFGSIGSTPSAIDKVCHIELERNSFINDCGLKFGKKSLEFKQKYCKVIKNQLWKWLSKSPWNPNSILGYSVWCWIFPSSYITQIN